MTLVPVQKIRFKGILLRVGLSLLILLVLLNFLDSDQLVDLVARLNPWLLILAVPFLVVLTVVGSLRWWLFLRAGGYRHGPLWIARVRLIGQGLNVLLPGGVAGDIVTLFYVSEPPERPASHVFGTVLADRIVGLLSIVFVLLVSAILVPGVWARIPLSGLELSVAVPLAGVVGLLALAVLSRWRRSEGILGRVWRAVVNALSVLARYRRMPGLLGVTFGIGAFLHLGICAIAWWISASLGQLSFPALVMAMSIAALAVVLPVSFNGLGVREVIFVLLLGGGEFGAEAATVLSLSWFVLTVVVFGGAGMLASALTPVPLDWNLGREITCRNE